MTGDDFGHESGAALSPSPIGFRGTLPASKSLLNRLLILQSYAPALAIIGESNADDVVKMRGALAALAQNQPADCGAAGTTFRFLALKAARLPGRHVLRGSRRLLERPQKPLVELLNQLGCRATVDSENLTIEGDGWKIPPRGLAIDRAVSSQFASAVLLNSWDLPQPLEIAWGAAVSEGYFQMTTDLVRRAGLAIVERESGALIPAGAKVRARELEAEPDLSSAFAVAALSVASGGRCEIENWPPRSLQPDAVFADLLERMGATVIRRDSSLCIERRQHLRAIEANLESAPDLFPVLAILCAMADGQSRLFGAPQLVHKESNRIAKTQELLSLIGVESQPKSDGMTIAGGGGRGAGVRAFTKRRCVFDPADDHRLAMAAAVAIAGGAQIELSHPETVNKSFPGFWSIAGSPR